MTEWFRTWIAKVAKDFVTCFITKDRWKYIVKGLGNTLQIALAAVLLGILIGTIVAIIRSTHDKTHETMRPGPGRTLLNIANWLCKVYLTVIRGTPAMIQILIMFFVVFSTARNGTPVAMLTFGINSGAYVAEIIRAGILAVVGMMVLFQVCKPFGAFRRIVWGAMLVCLVVVFTCLGELFELRSGTVQTNLLMLTLLLMTPTVFFAMQRLFDWGEKIIRRVSRRETA